MSVAWGKKIAIVLMMLGGFAGAQTTSYPDAPSSLTPNTWKKTLDWKFATVHGIYFGAMMFDQHETLRGEAMGCALEQGDPTPYYAHRGDLMKKNLPYFAGITVVDMLLRKVGVPIAWVAGPAVATTKHIQGGINWIHLCK